MLPQWQSAVDDLAAMGQPRSLNTEFLSTFRQYVQARKEGLELLIAVLRENDPQKLKQYNAAVQKADQLAKQLSDED